MVIGASSGLGLACTTKLAREEARVPLCSGSRERAEAAANRGIGEEHGGSVDAFQCDVADPSSLEKLFDDAGVALGGIDGSVTNAGGPPLTYLIDTSEGDWHRAHQLTLMSVLRSIRGDLPYLETSRGGAMLASASLSVAEPISNLVLSDVCRPAVHALCNHLSVELALLR